MNVQLDDVTAVGLSPIERIRITGQLGATLQDLQALPAGPAGMLQRLKATAKIGELVRKLGGGIAPPAPPPANQDIPAVDPAVDAQAPTDSDNQEPPEGEATSNGAFGLQRSGKKTREKINAAVVSLVDQIRAGRDAKTLTSDELALLKQYSGKGGLTENSQYEYYTPTPVAEGIWNLLAANGYQNGNVLEPSTGAGVFSATKPAGSIITGTEIDGIAATVNQVLHPEDQILNQSFEKLAVSAPDNSFDAVIGNVPFGDARGASAHDDPDYKSEKRIERYFIDRVIDKTRPGGLIALVVPTGVLGNTTGPWKRFRAKISRKAEFLGGHKLPSKTFGKQGTDVVTDILVLRKHPSDLLDKIDRLSAETLTEANVLWPEFIDGRYWKGEGRRFIHGDYIPPEASKARSMEQVIAPDGQTPEALKQQLAAKFDSRIDWAALDSAEPVIHAYATGDHRIINGKEHVFDGTRWAEVVYHTDPGTPIEAAKFGAATIEALQARVANPEAMLALTSTQAFNVYKKYPNLLNTQQRMAVEFAISQPLDKFREQAYRGSLIGSVITQYLARAHNGDADEGDRLRVKALVENEFQTFGPPHSAKGFVLDGEMARYFGAYLGAVDEQGQLSAVLTEGIEQAQGYDSTHILSTVEYLLRQSGQNLTLDDLKGLYTGPRALASLGDLADVDGVAITADGLISTPGRYLCGDVYLKGAALQDAMANEADPRLKAKFQKQLEQMMAKARHTSIEDISFGLRDKWLDQKYKKEFLENNGYRFGYWVSKSVEKTDADTGKTYLGYDHAPDTADPNGTWHASETDKKRSDFARQLEHYLNGKSIGHDVRDKGGVSAADRIAGFREQVNTLEEQFKFFMQSHPDFADIERRYNYTFNNWVKPDYDTADLGLEGLSGQVKTHGYQNQGIRQLSEEGTGILGYDVGLGKTYTSLAFSAYDRQMGRSKKHCIVVPKSVLANWYQESKKIYGDHNHMLFVGFEPKRDKAGVIQREPILDENGQPQKNRHTGDIEYQDILVEDDPATVYEKMHQIPQTSAAVVVMTYEKFGMIPMREESRLAYAEKWVQRNLMSRADANKIGKSYQEAKDEDRAEGQFSDDGTRKKKELPYFEDMGFDRVIVDEAHAFKNSFAMGGDTQQLAYLPNPASSQRARDLAMKISWLRDKYDGQGSILLTATPVANSPIEIFNMLSLVIDPAEFERYGVYTPDDFVRQFGIIQQVEKIRVSGELVNTEGLAGFKNLNALRALFHRYAIMRNAADVDPGGNTLKLPEAVEMLDQSDMDDEQTTLYAALREEARDAGNPKKIASGEARPMFAVIRDMDRVTTDIDLYHRTITFLFKAADQTQVEALIADLPASIKVRMTDDDSGEKADFDIRKTTEYTLEGDTLTYVAPEGYEEAVNSRLVKFKIDYVNHPLRPKYARLLANMQAELDSQGKQIIFTEEKSQHGKLVRIIINHLPITADQIAIINADTAGGERLQQLSDAYNRGDLRIIVANKKAEVGVNLQKGTSAIHHLTLPWNPASIQQRNGRGVRQGNTVAQVRVYYYQARGSFDEYRLDLLKNKGNWIANLMDRTNESDTAENAQALGAIEQAALLSENREEFLKTLAEQKAKKAAEDKARRDNAAKVKLNQLAMIELTLSRFEADKTKAIESAQKALEGAQAKLDKARSESADEPALERLQRDLAIAQNRLTKVEPTWEEKRAQAESQRRQLAAFLRGQAAKGELPFDAAAVEDPLGVIMTKERLIVQKGKAYRIPEDSQRYRWSNAIVKVTAVDFAARQVQVETVIGTRGPQADREYGVDDVFAGAIEVNLTPDEIQRLKWLEEPKDYAALADIPKDFFLEHVNELRLDGYMLFRASSSLKYGYGYSGDRSTIVYPDKEDKALQAELLDVYKALMVGTATQSRYEINAFMPVFFGQDWEETLKAHLKTASPEELRAQAARIVSEKTASLPHATSADIQSILAVLESTGYAYGVRTLAADARDAIVAWMTGNGFVNLDDARKAVVEAVTAEKAALAERKRQLLAEEERTRNEALKSDPNYQEVPADLADQFEAIGLTVFYNTEVVQVEGFKRRSVAPFLPFERVFIKDRHGKNGVVFRMKEILKSRFGAQFCGGVVRGDRKYGDSTWHVPASTNLEALYELLS